MIFIDLKSNPPPQALIAEGERLTAELMALSPNDRKPFIERYSNYWGKLKEYLYELSHGKCWYTEARDVASIYHVDHFRPKNKTQKLVKDCDIPTYNNKEPYWWLAFDWRNYRLSCSIPNTSKNAYFPLRPETDSAKNKEELNLECPGLLDPTDEDDVIWMGFSDDGQVCPACIDDDTWEAQRVRLSVRIYNLNSPPLVDARKEIHNVCERLIKEIVRIHADYKHNNNPIIKEQLKSKIQELRNMTIEKAELSSVAKSHILNSSVVFIKRIAS